MRKQKQTKLPLARFILKWTLFKYNCGNNTCDAKLFDFEESKKAVREKCKRHNSTIKSITQHKDVL